MKTPTKLIDKIKNVLAILEPATPEKRTNPFSRVTCELEPEACMLYDFITTRKYVCGKDYTIKEWNKARMYFLQKWPEAYYSLID